jgi:outer membrane immunogenic protein
LKNPFSISSMGNLDAGSFEAPCDLRHNGGGWFEASEESVMKTIILASVLVATGCASTSAADLAAAPASKAYAMVDTAYNWTGFYVGGHVGAGWARGSMIGDPFPDPPSYGIEQQVIALGQSTAAVGGGQIGYNWQLSPRFLLGLEADFSATGLKGSGTSGPLQAINPLALGALLGSSAQASRQIDGLGSIRGRGGIIWDRLLVYATGGVAWEHAKYTANEALPNLGNSGGYNNPGSLNSTRPGWVVGGGLEYAWTGKWIVRAEYLHYHFKDSFFGATTPASPPYGIQYNTETELDVVRVGLSYKFGDPMIAR